MTDPLFARFGREFPVDAVLFREGDEGEVMYVIRSGAVRISKTINGDERVLAVLGPGEFLGELAILNGKPRTATAIVVEPMTCLVVEARTLESMVAKNMEIALRLIKKLARRLASADTLVEILTQHDPRARVMLALSRHAEGFGEQVDEGVRVRTTTAALAKEVGVDLALASEVMARLGRLGLAHEDGGAIVVKDVDRLHDFMEFLETPRRLGGEG